MFCWQTTKSSFLNSTNRVSHPDSSQDATVAITITVEDDNDNCPKTSLPSYTFDLLESAQGKPFKHMFWFNVLF